MIIGPADGAGVSQQRGDTFTGVVWATPVISGAEGAMIASVTFQPGARTFWHSHDNGQVLQVLAGSGLICAEGGQPRALRPGDMVWAPPGEVHWHGAAPSAILTHLAVSLGTTRWAGPVSDADYGTVGGPDSA
jgi:quercetin dioxygenase-like cupin family protein